jgi:phosphatidylglycerophosphate synthase
MLDGIMRRLVGPGLDRIGGRLAAAGVRADQLTLAGAGAALAMGAAIAADAFMSALIFLGLSRLADGLDGAVARRNGLTDFGGYLDIVCDFIFYGALPLAFALHDPAHALPAAVLLASFYLNGASFLGFAILAERRGLKTDIRGAKSLYFTTGLAEGSETIAVFVAMLLWPGWFPVLAYGFAGLCLITFVARVRLAAEVFHVGE